MRSKTHATKASEVERKWHLVDVEGRVLGRVASEISKLLIGKHKLYYAPYLDCGDNVVVVNASKVDVTGDKKITKEYIRHSGYPGGLKKETLGQLLKRRPEEVIRKAVWGMMPKTKLGRQMMKKLYIYPGVEHPYGSQIKIQKSKIKV